ncbi:hypothetical protein B0O80DRAFT_534542 [Mortierella sp. GBAus27b]|nr:hypothetical protein B0O80DRAFT_534542 [Mortierella sp. GBAus27b]
MSFVPVYFACEPENKWSYKSFCNVFHERDQDQVWIQSLLIVEAQLQTNGAWTKSRRKHFSTLREQAPKSNLLMSTRKRSASVTSLESHDQTNRSAPTTKSHNQVYDGPRIYWHQRFDRPFHSAHFTLFNFLLKRTKDSIGEERRKQFQKWSRRHQLMPIGNIGNIDFFNNWQGLTILVKKCYPESDVNRNTLSRNDEEFIWCGMVMQQWLWRLNLGAMNMGGWLIPYVHSHFMSILMLIPQTTLKMIEPLRSVSTLPTSTTNMMHSFIWMMSRLI